MDGMIPAGYLYKRVAARPDWLREARHVEDIYSISRCISDDFADYSSHWLHNGAWLFDDPAIMEALAHAEGIALDGAQLFYYEIHDHEFNEDTSAWSPLALKDFPMRVVVPAAKALHGFDVNCASQRNLPECSPLSCNALGTELAVNRHCLMETLEAARAALEQGRFDRSEPGPFRIYAVYTVGES
jgi:hypothetical protein